MNLQCLDSSFQIRTLHDNSPVKSSRTKQCLVENLRTVCCRQNNKTFGRIKAIHLRQKCIQRLFSLIVSAAVMAVTAFSDGIHLINKNDTRSHGLCLLKEVTNSRSTDTDKHFHKVRTAQREERHIGFSGYGFGQKGFTGSRRAHQQSSFRKSGTDFYVFSRIVQKIHHLCQGFLGFILSRHIGKGHSGLFFHINLGIAFSDASHHSAAFTNTAHYKHGHGINQNKRQDIACQNGYDHGRAAGFLSLKGYIGRKKTVYQLIIRNPHNVVHIFHQGIGLFFRFNRNPAV